MFVSWLSEHLPLIVYPRKSPMIIFQTGGKHFEAYYRTETYITPSKVRAFKLVLRLNLF